MPQACPYKETHVNVIVNVERFTPQDDYNLRDGSGCQCLEERQLLAIVALAEEVLLQM